MRGVVERKMLGLEPPNRRIGKPKEKFMDVANEDMQTQTSHEHTHNYLTNTSSYTFPIIHSLVPHLKLTMRNEMIRLKVEGSVN